MKLSLATKLATLLAILTCATARAQYDSSERGASQGLTVSGIGTAKGRPNLAKIEIRMQGSAEITDDALVKYRDGRRRLQEALEKLKLENMRVTEQALSMGCSNSAGMQGMMNGGGNQTESNPTEIAGHLRVELTNLQAMQNEDVLKNIGKVLDAIRDAGGLVGPNQNDMRMMWGWGRQPRKTAVKFVLNDFKKLRDQSYQKAVEDVRERATQLATLNGVKLGEVLSVHEVFVAGDQQPSQPNRVNYYGWGGSDDDEVPDGERDEIVTEKLDEVPVTVRLMVRFAIAANSAKPSGGESK